MDWTLETCAADVWDNIVPDLIQKRTFEDTISKKPHDSKPDEPSSEIDECGATQNEESVSNEPSSLNAAPAFRSETDEGEAKQTGKGIQHDSVMGRPTKKLLITESIGTLANALAVSRPVASRMQGRELLKGRWKIRVVDDITYEESIARDQAGFPDIYRSAEKAPGGRKKQN